MRLRKHHECPAKGVRVAERQTRPKLDENGEHCFQQTFGCCVSHQVILGTVNASRSNYQNTINGLEQFMVLFPEAVLSLLSRVAIRQALDVLARGRGIKDVVTFAA